MHSEQYIYHDKDDALHGHISFHPDHSKKPAVLVFHDWSGCNPFAMDMTRHLAELGYVGLAADIYGDGQTGETIEEKQALMMPFKTDRAKLNARIQAAFHAVSTHDAVDSSKVAAIGFCFGGLCALDLARTNTSLQGAVSFHGLLDRPESLPITPINTKILVLHGYDDPMVPPEQVQAFCGEMNEAKADWQVHMYGQTKHAFTNPLANDANLGTVFEPRARDRSFQSMENFLAELFG